MALGCDPTRSSPTSGRHRAPARVSFSTRDVAPTSTDSPPRPPMQRRFALLLPLLSLVGCARSSVSPGSPAAVPARVTVGADRLFPEFSHLIRGKRLALVSNHSGRLADDTHLADALHDYPDADLRVLFGMEFDIRS